MKIGFIGCGHMGSALAQAIGGGKAHELYIADRHPQRLDALCAATGALLTDAQSVILGCDFVFIGVKPHDMPGLLRDLQSALTHNPKVVLISMAAGITVSAIRQMLTSANPVIRILPNTPVALGEGMTVYTVCDRLKQEQEMSFAELMRPTGRLERIDETLIDAACVVAGCGPAYAYLFADALAKAGEAAGLCYEDARAYAAQMLRGAATMMLQTQKSPETLCREVCSPGGSTIEGVRVFQNEGLFELVQRAFDASYKRTAELGQVKK